MGKGEIARYEQFLLFPQCFLPIWRTLCHFHQSWNCCLQSLSVWRRLKFVVWERVNTSSLIHLDLFHPFPNKPLFLRVCRTSLLKTLWEKEKLLVTSDFSFSHKINKLKRPNSFSHSVFYPFVELSVIFIKYKSVVLRVLEFGSV